MLINIYTYLHASYSRWKYPATVTITITTTSTMPCHTWKILNFRGSEYFWFMNITCLIILKSAHSLVGWFDPHAILGLMFYIRYLCACVCAWNEALWYAHESTHTHVYTSTMYLQKSRERERPSMQNTLEYYNIIFVFIFFPPYTRNYTHPITIKTKFAQSCMKGTRELKKSKISSWNFYITRVVSL